MQPTSSGDLGERWCDREQASTTARFFTSSCAKNISAGIYVVALTPRQKNQPLQANGNDMFRRVVHYLYTEEQMNVWCE